MSQSPNYQDFNYQRHSKQWHKMHNFREGKDSVVRYHLQKWERESEEGFEDRKKRATLFNAVEKTIKGANGLVFRKEITVEDLNKAFVEKMDNIDNQHTDFNAFAREVNETSLWYGMAYIMLDFPRNDTEIASYQQQIDLGIIPYFTLFNPLQCYNRRISDNKLTQITFRTMVIEDDGDFGEKEVEQFIVLNIGRGRIYEGDVVIHEWNTGLDFIPVVPVYSNKTGHFEAKPRFSNLADLNIKHMSYDSQNDKTLFIAANPIPKIYGNFAQNEKSEKVVIGVDEAMVFNDKDSGDFQWEEFQGTCVDKLEAKLKTLETLMSVIGLSILTNDPTSTATEKLIDNAGENADLSAIASSLQWSLNTAYAYWCKMMKVDNSGMITVNKDFNAITLDYNKAKTLLEMYQNNTITLEQLWIELQKGEFLGEFDKEVAKAELSAKQEAVKL